MTYRFPLTDEALIAVAEAIAVLAHRGQTDKAGEPYIGHPRRVAARLTGAKEKAVALLHDVLEDSAFTSADLAEAGIPGDVIADVINLTRGENQSVEDYYAIIATDSPRARRVKLAEIADNSDIRRLALLKDDATVVRLVRKYAKARLLLGDES
jgi:(p)ppGpp synthase/HD superfamily hydrolase